MSMTETRIILRLKDISGAELALRSAERLIADGYDSCVYTYSNDAAFYVYRTKRAIVAVGSR